MWDGAVRVRSAWIWAVGGREKAKVAAKILARRGVTKMRESGCSRCRVGGIR